MRLSIIIFVIFMLNGCASILSSPKDSTIKTGLTYYMPKKDIQLSVTVSNGYPTQLQVQPSDPYPDTRNEFYLNHSGGLIGKNVADVQISNGLLTSTKATFTSNVSDIFKNLAAAAATLKFREKLVADGAPRHANKCADGIHTFLVEAAIANHTVCEVDIKVWRRQVIPTTNETNDVSTNSDRAGIYYRQNFPYIVEATSKAESNTDIHSAALVFSPSESGIYFLPISRTLFANNEAEFSFDKGVPTKYRQDTDGELVALATLPAVVFSAYFEAAGKVFDAFSTKNTKNITEMQSDISLETMKIKYNACMAAAQAGDEEKMITLKCGEKL